MELSPRTRIRLIDLSRAAALELLAVAFFQLAWERHTSGSLQSLWAEQLRVEYHLFRLN